MQCIGFTLAGEYFGVDLQMVLEIIRPAPVVALPNAPDFIHGVVNLRRGILPVINIRKKLNLVQAGARTPGSRFLIFDIRGTAGCLAVDSVTGIQAATDPADMNPSTSSPGDGSAPYLKGILTVDDKQMKILELTRIFDAEEQGQLETLGPSAQGLTHG